MTACEGDNQVLISWSLNKTRATADWLTHWFIDKLFCAKCSGTICLHTGKQHADTKNRHKGNGTHLHNSNTCESQGRFPYARSVEPWKLHSHSHLTNEWWKWFLQTLIRTKITRLIIFYQRPRDSPTHGQTDRINVSWHQPSCVNKKKKNTKKSRQVDICGTWLMTGTTLKLEIRERQKEGEDRIKEWIQMESYVVKTY